jgi:hypothetical protein
MEQLWTDAWRIRWAGIENRTAPGMRNLDASREVQAAEKRVSAFETALTTVNRELGEMNAPPSA